MEECQDCFARAFRAHWGSGCRLVFWAVLCAVLFAECAEGRRAVGQHHDCNSTLLGTGFFVFFGWLSDKIGRKPIIMAGLALAIFTYFPLFKALTWAANPALAAAQQNVRATVTAAPGDCKFQFNPTGTAKFTTSCDIATSFLTRNSVPYDVVATAAPGTAATVKIGNETVKSYDAVAAGADAKAKETAFAKGINVALQDGGYPLVRDPVKVVEFEA